MSRPRILLADDHQIVAEGLRSILEPEFELVAVVADGRQLVDEARRLQPDVIVADITMPLLSGLEAADQLRQSGCTAKIVFLTMHKDSTYAARAMSAGASGFVLKHSAGLELLTAVREAIAGRTYVTASLKDELQRVLSARKRQVESNEPLLTPRQREILQLFAEGRKAREVSSILHISTRTAENHKARIMSALGLTNTADLVQYAARHGMISPS